MQLSAWTSSTEKTVIAAADAPDALPELSNEASGGAASKGFQQITGWQVVQHLTASQWLRLLYLASSRGSYSADLARRIQGNACVQRPAQTCDLRLEFMYLHLLLDQLLDSFSAGVARQTQSRSECGGLCRYMT